MNILAIDTATEACSAALLMGHDLIERHEIAPRQHNHLILPMIQSLLDEAGISVGLLTGLAFGAGPGSFTGIRIAAGVTQGLAMGLDLQVAPISTLKAMAFRALNQHDHELAGVAIDARMDEVYWAVYGRGSNGILEHLIEDQVIPPHDVRMPDEGSMMGVGTGWGTYGDVLIARSGHRDLLVEPQIFPRAGDIAQLGAQALERGEGVPPEKVLPIYLRNNVAQKSTQRLRVE